MNRDILSSATCKEKRGNICISNSTSSLLSEQGTTGIVDTDTIYVPSTDREYPLRSKKAKITCSLLEKFFTTKYSVQIPEHPKSNDFISDFTVAADSEGVGDALLMQTPCQRLVVSVSRESTSSAVSLQSRNQIKLRGNRKCKQKLEVFICSKANLTTYLFYRNAQNMEHSLECSCSFPGVPGKHQIIESNKLFCTVNHTISIRHPHTG